MTIKSEHYIWNSKKNYYECLDCNIISSDGLGVQKAVYSTIHNNHKFHVCCYCMHRYNNLELLPDTHYFMMTEDNFKSMAENYNNVSMLAFLKGKYKSKGINACIQDTKFIFPNKSIESLRNFILYLIRNDFTLD